MTNQESSQPSEDREDVAVAHGGTVSRGRSRVEWILIAARLIGLAVIFFGVWNVINVAAQSSSGGFTTSWLQFAASAAGAASTGLLLIVAAEILDCLIGQRDG